MQPGADGGRNGDLATAARTRIGRGRILRGRGPRRGPGARIGCGGGVSRSSVIEDARGLRVMMSYRNAHYDAADVAALVAAVGRSFAAFASAGAADRPLDALLP